MNKFTLLLTTAILDNGLQLYIVGYIPYVVRSTIGYHSNS